MRRSRTGTNRWREAGRQRNPGDASQDDKAQPKGQGVRGGPWTVLAVLGFVTFTYAFQQTAVIPVIPTIEHYFHASAAWSAWLLSGYLMVATVATPAFGRLGDLHGTAQVLLWSLTVFFAGSVGAALLPDLPGVILCRAAQGIGGAVLPLSFAVARHHLPDRLVGRAIGGLVGAFGLGATVGFATGGVMADAVSWHLVFATGAVSVATGILFMLWAVPRAGGSAEGTFDTGGAIWLGAASVTVLLALTLGVQAGWASPAPVLLLLTGVAAVLLWIRTELRHPEPLIDLRVLRNRMVALVNTATAGLGWSRFTGLLLIPELVRGPGGHGYGFGASAAVAGLYLVPDGIGTLLGGPAAGALTRRFHLGRVFTVGLAIIAAGAIMLSAGLSSPAVVLAASFALGAGSGLAIQVSSAVTTRDVPHEDAAASSSLNATVRRFSGGIGGQVSTVILVSMASGAASAAGFTAAFAVAAALALGGAGFSLAVRRPHADHPRP